MVQGFTFFNRDLSWLSFNERVLAEAGNPAVPLVERIRFLSIYSSNLDEFYRVRVPAVAALQQLDAEYNIYNDLQTSIPATVNRQQEMFGSLLSALIPELDEKGICFVYNQDIPPVILPALKHFFFTQILAFLQPVYLGGNDFFPESNRLYMAASVYSENGKNNIALINIPSDKLPRFTTIMEAGRQYIVFTDDIIREFLPLLFTDAVIKDMYSFKITRNADLSLEDEYEDDLAEKIEQQLAKRDLGLATRFLYDPAMPLHLLHALASSFSLPSAGLVAGGRYHNLKDLSALPVQNKALEYPSWPALSPFGDPDSLLAEIERRDMILHTPWQQYDTVLRFFNEAAASPDVEEIYVTLYRVANDSRIVNALISAARNGKKVFVLVELKARFDEANNIRWARQMRNAGVKIIYSVIALKVHAKIALVKKRCDMRIRYYGLLSTGNFNESTAKFYTDHILLTAHHGILRELELLFIFLSKRRKKIPDGLIHFDHLLVAQFTLQQRFLAMIDREMEHHRKGFPSGITIRLNNLEEKVLISKLYEASNAGVRIQLIVRSICCLIPGVPGQSEHITVTRIVDRFLEHGRLFIFCNNNREEIYLGSADWMNRNIYRRIEVCFPVYDPGIRQQLKEITALQLQDNVQAVHISSELENTPIKNDSPSLRSQEAIYEYLKQQRYAKV